MKQRGSGYVGRSFALLASVAATAWVMLGTPWGLGLSPDSVAYLASAKTLLEQGALDKLTPRFPPGYPLLLAIGGSLTGNFPDGARVIQSLGLSANVLLLFAMLRRAGVTALAASLLVVLVAAHPDVVLIHLVLWSEAVFMVLVLAHLLLLERALQRPSPLLLAAAACAALAILVRYAGFYLLLVDTLALLLLARRSTLSRRSMLAAGTATLVLAPVMTWIFYRGQFYAQPGQLEFHPPSGWQWDQAQMAFAGWLGIPANFGLVVPLGLAALCFFGLRSAPASSAPLRSAAEKVSDDDRILPSLLSLNLISYAGFLLFSITFASANTPLDARLLVPMLLPALVLCGWALRDFEHHRAKLVAGVVLCGALSLTIPASVLLWIGSRANGIGLGSRALQQAPVMLALRSLPASWTFATNGPELFTLHLPQGARMLPKRFDAGSLRANTDFEQEWKTMVGCVDGVVFFSAMGYRNYLPDSRQLDSIDGFTAIYGSPDAVVWVKDSHLPTLRDAPAPADDTDAAPVPPPDRNP